jgi:hypothetical protein
VRGRGVGLGGVEAEGETGLGNHVDAFVDQLKVADNLVVKVLGTGAVVADIVRAPTAAKVIAAGGQFPDKVVQAFVEGVTAGLGTEDRDAGVGGFVPVWVEAVGVVVKEGVASKVRLPTGGAVVQR